MSVDLSNEEVQRLQRAVLDKDDPTTWFLLQYDPSNPSALTPLASGPNPPLPQIKENLAACGEELVYGYADVQGKGLVVVYMVEGVGGVRRARAVVHSRALASLFPDYSALVTINKSSDLTDDLVAEKLGLDPTSLSHTAPSNVMTATQGSSALDPISDSAAPQSTAMEPEIRSSSDPSNPSERSSPSNNPLTSNVFYLPPRQSSLGTDQAVSPTSVGLRPDRSNSPRQLPSPPSNAPLSSSDAVPHTPTMAPKSRDSLPNDALSPSAESRILTPSSAPAVDSHSPPPTILGPPVDLESSAGRKSNDAARSQGSVSPSQPPRSSNDKPDSTAVTEPTGDAATPSQALQRDLDLAAGTAAPADPITPTAPNTRINDLSTVTPSGEPAPLPLADRSHVQAVSPLSDRLPSPTQPTVIQPDKPLDVKGIASTDLFPEQRTRKTSLTSRLGSLGSLGQAFGRGGSPRSSSGSAPQDQGIRNSPGGQSPLSTPSQSQKGPGSPTMSRFINSNLIKNFGRRISATGIPSPPASPRDAAPQETDTDVPPPLPPKDTPSPRQVSDAAPTQLAQPTTISTNFIGNQTLSEEGRPDSGGRGSGRGGGISPSPSAKLALTAVSQKSVRTEMEIQERFRRDLELKAQEKEKERLAETNGTGSHLDDGDDDEGLPYDRPDPDEKASSAAMEAKEVTPHQGLPSSEVAKVGGAEAELAAADLAETGAAGAGAAILAQSLVTEGQGQRAGAQGVPEDVSPGTSPEELQPGLTMAGSTIPSLVAHEVEPSATVEPTQEHDTTRQAQEVEERRLTEQQNDLEQKLIEEERVRKEEEERVRIEQEARRAQAEKEAEEARVRSEQEAEARRVQLEREAEEARQRAQQEAEEQKLREERLAQEVQRRAEVRAEMMSGKREGRVMLNGWITVQTTKSLTWRRRHFTLFAHEMQLFKSEGDPKPIQTIRLGDSAKVSHTYEESQVQGSFKITSSDGDDFFLFTDGPEDRETVLEGLAVALGQS